MSQLLICTPDQTAVRVNSRHIVLRCNVFPAETKALIPTSVTNELFDICREIKEMGGGGG
jgi:hypothetical protein